MRIAIATEDGSVAEHFGRCRSYTLVDIEDEKIVHRQTVENPGHEPGRLPALLGDYNADIVVAGGMGVKAQRLFEQMGIEQILGVTGTVEETVESCRAGSLSGAESLCSHEGDHGHHHEHGNHHEHDRRQGNQS